MAIPINAVDMKRFGALAALLFAKKMDDRADLSIYVNTDSKSALMYVSLELKGYLPKDEVNKIFDAESEVYIPGSENDTKE